jgi:neutral ceramidase
MKTPIKIFGLATFAGLIVAATVGVADLIEQGPKDSAPSGLLAGVARADITPPVGIAQMNWGSQSHILSVGNDPVGLYATALVVSDGSNKFAMVDIDRLFVNGLEPAIEQASALTGIPAAHIRLGATHTHSGAQTSSAKGPAGMDLSSYKAMVERYDNQIIDKIVGILVEANAKLQPAHIYGASGVGKININRRVRAEGDDPPAVGRNPAGFVDRELVVLRIDNANGDPLAVVANFQCHGTTLAYENKYISPDWVGMVRKVVENAMPGATCLYFQGAAGNQGPIEGFTGDLAVAHRLGSILGHQIASVALGIETVDRVPTFEGFVESTAYQAKQHWRVKGPRDSTLQYATRIIELPRRRYTEKEIVSMEERVIGADKKLAASNETRDVWKIHQAGARLRRFRDLLEAWNKPVDPSPVKLQVEIMRIGEVAIVSMPGEAFAEIGVAVKQASPFAVTLFCGYSDGVGSGYLPTRAEYDHGGYEVERTPYGLEAEKMVIAEAIALFDQVK